MFDILKREANLITVQLKTSIAFANTLRCILLSEVPSIAIHHVVMKKNTSSFPDEMIGHRLGLVPIQIEDDVKKIDSTGNMVSFLKDKIGFAEHCYCTDYCDDCSISISLFKRNTTNDVMNIFGNDLKISSKHVQKIKFTNSLILKLAPGQIIDIECRAIRGSPKTHIKYSPVACVKFTYDTSEEGARHRDLNMKKKEENYSEDTNTDECKNIIMGIEVLENVVLPEIALSDALYIFKKKLEAIKKSLI